MVALGYLSYKGFRSHMNVYELSVFGQAFLSTTAALASTYKAVVASRQKPDDGEYPLLRKQPTLEAIQREEESLIAFLALSKYGDLFGGIGLIDTLLSRVANNNLEARVTHLEHARNFAGQLFKRVRHYQSLHRPDMPPGTGGLVVRVYERHRLTSLAEISDTLNEWGKVLEEFGRFVDGDNKPSSVMGYEGGSLLVWLSLQSEVWVAVTGFLTQISSVVLAHRLHQSALRENADKAETAVDKAHARLEAASLRQEEAKARQEEAKAVQEVAKAAQQVSKARQEKAQAELFLKICQQAIDQHETQAADFHKARLAEIVGEFVESLPPREDMNKNEAHGRLFDKGKYLMDFLKAGNAVSIIKPEGVGRGPNTSEIDALVQLAVSGDKQLVLTSDSQALALGSSDGA
jgi:hypothetical protein